MFLTTTDYENHQANKDLEILTKGDTTVRNFAENAAEEEMKTYLRKRFDVQTEFAKTGSDRNAFLVMKLIDITIYHMFAKVAQRQTPEDVGIRYEEAIKWLTGVSKGHFTPDIEPIQEANKEILFGGSTKINWR